MKLGQEIKWARGLATVLKIENKEVLIYVNDKMVKWVSKGMIEQYNNNL